MNINFMSVLLGSAGLAIGGIGLVAQEIDRQPADTGAVQSTPAAWPPDVPAARVAFNDEMIELLTLGAKPRTRAEPVPRTQAAPSEGDTHIRSIRLMRAAGSRRAQVADIEFVDQDGRAYRRSYPIGQEAFAAGDARDVDGDRSAAEANAYAPPRTRRSGRGYYRRWNW
ncbi:MAG: hypothetical protein K2Y71_25785 [Xanthobacteraceae bacterium]|nr:hypothetical protein [Xanthobacteraceae bacterium]